MTLKGSILIKKLFRRLTRLGLLHRGSSPPGVLRLRQQRRSDLDQEEHHRSVTGHDDRKRIAQFRKSAPPAADGGRHFNPRSTSKAANILAAIEKRAHEHLQCTEELVPFESRVTLVKGTQCLLKARAGEYDKSADRRELTVAA
ncbi:uncharacterized protein SETTUDRAFT_25106 [Exserohilum turcica Et28A]|uniref:Uncharacterized protein n=1 Tax=Exserohilum turcicum (strain 28A) TaxID=671987 RepID=R0KT84_EXST2|nr:uncharacterized protein SETTUDRAFT_25106 [Exserohilum turcica Et28A]EOA91012.1 hypothetical protein SETTUDRAFT_25106 [Exserohilum turcica Et28A]